MQASFKPLGLFILFAGLVAMPVHAETFHTCATIIASLPTVITSQGVYCLAHDLTTAITTGNAIDIQTNNVTIDCNGYKIGGLAAGAASTAVGVHADNTRQNITVRNCGVRGFYAGIHLQGGAGHLIADNRLDGNLAFGIVVSGDHSRIERNRVYDTGGYVGGSSATGIVASADVIDNTVDGVFAAAAISSGSGIEMDGAATEARNNNVRGLLTSGGGLAVGIEASATGITLRNNSVAASGSTPGFGINGNGVTDTVCIGNTTLKFTNAFLNCQDGGGNIGN